jgi:hypothetical protein
VILRDFLEHSPQPYRLWAPRSLLDVCG